MDDNKPVQPDELRRALLRAEEDRTRLAYLKHPDEESEADDWSTAGEWKD